MAGLIEALVLREFSKPFQWGDCDCCLAVANVLVAIGRRDPAVGLRGTYSDEEGARTALRGSVPEMAAREATRLGWPEIAPEEAKPGDVGLQGTSILVRTEHAWVGKGLQGACVLRTVERAWRTA